MPYAHHGDVDLYYEVSGPQNGPTVILVQGYSGQLTDWPPPLLDGLHDRGIRTVVFDNRDSGLSSQLGTPDEPLTRKYTMYDMADDVAAVADELGLDRFHIFGCSMGGMIVQQVLVRHSRRIKSVTLMYTIPSFSPEWMANPDSADKGSHAGLDAEETREAAIEMGVIRARECSVGSVYPFDEQAAREHVAANYDRSYRPDGWARQNIAVEGYGTSQEELAALDLPAAVIHGRNDPFFSVKAGIRLSELLNGELHLYPGMAHEFPEPLADEFVTIIARTIAKGEERG